VVGECQQQEEEKDTNPREPWGWRRRKRDEWWFTFLPGVLAHLDLYSPESLEIGWLIAAFSSFLRFCRKPWLSTEGQSTLSGFAHFRGIPKTGSQWRSRYALKRKPS
jgi:hypothetical protein